jgi:hypothetical protein
MPNNQNLCRTGRKPGAKNRKTVAREMAASAAIAALVEKLSPDEIAALRPLDVLATVMIMLFRSGKLMDAANVAEKLAPYTNARIGAAAVGSEIPADLLPDDPPTPDKPGPLHPIL